MSLWFYLIGEKEKVCPHCGVILEKEEVEYFDNNITSNLSAMAARAGLYDSIWRPDQNGYETAGKIIIPLEIGLRKLLEKPEYFKQFNPPNGWGDYENLVEFVSELLGVCKEYPDGKIVVIR